MKRFACKKFTMKLYIVCLLVALACVAAMPTPQQSGNVGAASIGPFTTLYELVTLLPNTVITTAQNAIRGIPLINILPAALQSGILVGKHVAEGMDHTISGILGGRGGPSPISTLLSPFGLLGGQNNAQAGGQVSGGQLNPANFLNNLNPFNFLNGGGASQNGQLPGQQNPNGNNPLNTLANGAAQALNQLSPAAFAQFPNGQRPNQQSPNAAPNVAPSLVPNTSSSNPTIANPATAPVRAQDEQTQKSE